MSKTLLVMRNEIRATLQRKTFVIVAFGVPWVLGVVSMILMAVNRDTPGPLVLASGVRAPQETRRDAEGYVDEGGLIQVLPADVPSGWLTEYPDTAAAQAALEAGKIAAYYVIPEDFVQRGQLDYVRLQYNPVAGRASTDAMERIVLANLVGDPELAARVRNPLDVQVTALERAGKRPEEDGAAAGLLPNVVAFLLYIVILMPAGVLVNAVTDEKKYRVMEVLMSSVSPRQMLTGKILALGLIGLLQSVLWFGMLLVVVRLGGQRQIAPEGLTIPAHLLLWVLVYAGLGYAMYGSQMAGVGALAPDIRDTRSATVFVLAPLMVAYIFLIAIFARPEGPIALALSFFPLTSPVAMTARMTVMVVPVWQSALAALLQLLAAILIVRTIARLFRAQTLLSGQPLTVRRFVRVLVGRA